MEEEIKEQGERLIAFLLRAQKENELHTDTFMSIQDNKTGMTLPIKWYSSDEDGNVEVMIDTSPLSDYHFDKAFEGSVEGMNRNEMLFDLYKIMLESPENPGSERALEWAKSALKIFINQKPNKI